MGVTQRADIYSVGVVLWELATEYKIVIPIGMNHEEYFKIEDELVLKEYKKMVHRCLKSTSGDHPGIVEIIQMLANLQADSA